MWSSASGVGVGVGSGVAVGDAGPVLGTRVGGAVAAADADGAAEAVLVLQAAMIGARAAVAPTTEIRCRSWRRVRRSSAR